METGKDGRNEGGERIHCRAQHGHLTNDELEERKKMFESKVKTNEKTKEGGVEVVSAEMREGERCVKEDE